MARMSIIKKCVEIIDNNTKEDSKYYEIYYYLSYKDGKIRFIRTTRHLTGETYSNGEVSCEWDAPMKDYCNLAIVFANEFEDLKQYEYGENVEAITFLPIP